jgi:hypothetical protein
VSFARTLLAGALATALAASAASAAKSPAPRSTHTDAGTALARRLLLTRADLPRGWAATPASGKTPRLTCAGFSPSTEGIVETGAAASPAFRAGASGPFVTETVYVYASAAQAKAFWQRLVGPGLRSCLVQTVTQASTTDVRFAVQRSEQLTLPRAGARSASYRLTATATAPGQTVAAYIDMLLVAQGRAVAALSVSSFSQPVARSLELALRRAAARRVAAS